MSTINIKYNLNAQLADNTVTTDNKEDKILSLVSAGTADKQRSDGWYHTDRRRRQGNPHHR